MIPPFSYSALLGGTGGMSNPMSATGDMIVGGSSGTPARLAAGSNGQILALVAGSPAWQAQNTGGDTNWANVVSLLNFTGTSGSVAFPDLAAQVVWTAVGNAQIDTSLGYSVGLFDGTGDALSAGGSSVATQLQLGSSDFTIEFIVKTSGTSAYGICGNLNDSNGNGHYWVKLNSTFTGLHTVQFGIQGTTYKFGSAALSTTGEHHIELSRSGTNLYCFVDGVQLGTTQTLNNFTGTTSSTFRIGATWNGTSLIESLNGYLRAFRITKGVARHTTTTSFTPPNAPFLGAPFGSSSGEIVPVTSAFTTFGANITATDKVDRLQMSVTSGTVLNGLLQNSIATPYTIDAHVRAQHGHPATSDAIASGICLSDGTKFRAFYAGFWNAGSNVARTTQFSIDSWTASTTFSAQVRTRGVGVDPSNYYARITDNGTTRRFLVSVNGKDFIEVYNEATNTYLTPTKFGLVVYNHEQDSITSKTAVMNWVVSNSVLGDAS